MYELDFPGRPVIYTDRQHQHEPQTVDPTTIGLPRVPERLAFEDPVHKYDAVEFTANKSVLGQLVAASRRTAGRGSSGNFEGFFRSDNGQSDPAITSLFDFPTNDPSYTPDRRAPVRLPRRHPLPGHDARRRACCPTTGRTSSSCTATAPRTNLNLGVGFNVGLRPPPDRRWPPTRSTTTRARSRESLRGGGIQTVDGFLTSTDTEVIFDLHADYAFKIGDRQRVILLADVVQPVRTTGPDLVRHLHREQLPGCRTPTSDNRLLGVGANTNAFQPPRRFASARGSSGSVRKPVG